MECLVRLQAAHEREAGSHLRATAKDGPRENAEQMQEQRRKAKWQESDHQGWAGVGRKQCTLIWAP